jgi:hypothetical protein
MDVALSPTLLTKRSGEHGAAQQGGLLAVAPGRILSATLQGGTESLTAAAAATLTAMVISVAVGCTGGLLVRRDVTS